MTPLQQAILKRVDELRWQPYAGTGNGRSLGYSFYWSSNGNHFQGGVRYSEARDEAYGLVARGYLRIERNGLVSLTERGRASIEPVMTIKSPADKWIAEIKRSQREDHYLKRVTLENGGRLPYHDMWKDSNGHPLWMQVHSEDGWLVLTYIGVPA